MGLTFLLTNATGAQAGVATYRISRTATPPRLDGKLDDACWKGALKIQGFGLLGKGKASGDLPPTSAFLAYDADYLYVAYRNGEPLSDRLILKAKQHDGRTWMDDCVEMFFNPSGDRRRYVQIVVNAAGVAMDGSYPGPSTRMDLGYESGIEVKTRIGKGEWTSRPGFPFQASR